MQGTASVKVGSGSGGQTDTEKDGSVKGEARSIREAVSKGPACTLLRLDACEDFVCMNVMCPKVCESQMLSEERVVCGRTMCVFILYKTLPSLWPPCSSG